MKKLIFSLTVFASLLGSKVAAQDYWQSQYTNFFDNSRGIAGIYAVNPKVAWAYAYDGTGVLEDISEFTKTSDGGLTWESGDIYLGGNGNYVIQNIVAVDANTAWVMASDPQTGEGGVFKTSDGGANWDFQKGATEPDSYNNWVHFFDANIGVLGSDPVDGYFELLRTTDGGTNWTRVPKANFPAVLTNEWGYNGQVSHVGDVLFFQTSKGRVFKSVDKGLNWTIMLPSGYISDFGSAAENGLVAFSNADKGLVMRKTFTVSGQTSTPKEMDLYRTVNGGVTWTKVTYTGISKDNRIASITYVPGTDILLATTPNATGDAQGSWKSLDNGTTWTRIDALQHTGNVTCVDALNCYSGGFSNASGGTGMFKSTRDLAVSDVKTQANVSIFPNPVTSYFKVNTSGMDAKAITVVVTDASGRAVKSFKNQDSYQVNDLAKGVYIVTVSDGKSIETKKIIKE